MSTNTKIVLIDDDQDLCDLLQIELEALGRFQVITSSDSAAALTLIKDEGPDIVVLDINMPGIHGVELAKALASEPSTREIPILYLTGMADPEEVNRLGGGQAPLNLISKQSPRADLVAALDALLSS
jgi:CheY-like chemotaxis protein